MINIRDYFPNQQPNGLLGLIHGEKQLFLNNRRYKMNKIDAVVKEVKEDITKKAVSWLDFNFDYLDTYIEKYGAREAIPRLKEIQAVISGYFRADVINQQLVEIYDVKIRIIEKQARKEEDAELVAKLLEV